MDLLIGSQFVDACYRGNTLLWESQARDGFPNLSVPTDSYMFFDARDAGGLTWTARYGLPLTIDAVGTPTLTDVNGITCLDGAYWVKRDPWPENISFSLWVLYSAVNAKGDTATGNILYNGIDSYDNSSINLLFAVSMARVKAGKRYVNFEKEDRTSGLTTLQWDRPASGWLSDLSAYQDGTLLPQGTSSNRAIDASGEYFVVSGMMKDGSATPSGSNLIAGVLLTVGTTLSALDRSLLHSWWQSRLV